VSKKKKKKTTETPLSGGSPVSESSSNSGEAAPKQAPQAEPKPVPAVAKPDLKEKKENNNVGESKAALLKKAQEGKKPKHTEEIGTGWSWKNSLKFLKEVQHEGRKITWPDRRQVVQETWTVLVLVTFITFLVLGYDFVLGRFIFGPIEHISKMNAKPVDASPFAITPDGKMPLGPDGKPMIPLGPDGKPIFPVGSDGPKATPDSASPGAPATPGTPAPAPTGATPEAPATTAPTGATPAAPVAPATTPPTGAPPGSPATPAPGVPVTPAPVAPTTSTQAAPSGAATTPATTPATPAPTSGTTPKP